MRKCVIFLAALFLLGANLCQAQDAKAVITKMDEKLRGNTSFAEISVQMIRPKYERTLELKTWGKGTDFAMILVTKPSKEKGTVILKKKREIWNWVPTIERTIKLPPSMMSQGFLSSDMTNEDLVQQSSIIRDYSHTMLGQEEIEGVNCFKIELVPDEEAAVVWGKIITWIDVEHYNQMRSEFYDEEDYLVNTMIGSDVQKMGGMIIPTKNTIIPEDKKGHKTIMTYKHLELDLDIKDSFFTTQNMKRVK